MIKIFGKYVITGNQNFRGESYIGQWHLPRYYCFCSSSIRKAEKCPPYFLC